MNRYKESLKWKLLTGLTLFCCIVMILTINPVAASQTAAVDDVEGLKEFLNSAITTQLEENNIAGAALSIVKDGEVILSEGYGFADLEKRTSVDPKTTLFRPGSVSKLFTWTAVMQLVE
ncbi:Beta-lactamase class C-like and penicillin binding proteins (PBPs) superfamily [Candidatus Syntrophocurvum alkaliphilum]|uniref:Beta-lactamase class C-like and penicillin binding proteins (PBPs) superfamily n=1 Tax=Candidatus Syntrophocurvum alkaliphilum TaxID=2293317 RepID=A0A6I6DE32_9FIRM|nr:serine hydrolase domain-containing protein [Candidatus Syntrophocurvum alkaliphilum]QGT98781.1 Beta-lactamase class C-like and penicillin binding proteins (PBPs) superfamily [Candidatus Syntrophocurvum alkaliphilum]